MTTAYIFPGQGSQFVGMGQSLYESEPIARALYDKADEYLGFPLTKLCFEGPLDVLTDTVNQQPALYVTSLAMLVVMRERNWGEAPIFMAGHSLGELSALAGAGSLNFQDGLMLVRRRGELMKEAGEKNPGGLAAILALNLPTVTKLCEQAVLETGKPVQVANDNCPGQIVISGHQSALKLAMSLAEEAGARKVVSLPITIAAHSELMSSAAQAFSEVVDTTPITQPEVPVISNTTAEPLTTPDAIRQELKAQLTGSVLWTETIQYMVSKRVDTFVEVGAGNVLLGLVKRIHRKSTRLQYDG